MMPQNVSFLERAIRKLANSNVGAYQLRVMMSNVIVGQFLENAVARGGTSTCGFSARSFLLWAAKTERAFSPLPVSPIWTTSTANMAQKCSCRPATWLQRSMRCWHRRRYAGQLSGSHHHRRKGESYRRPECSRYWRRQW